MYIAECQVGKNNMGERGRVCKGVLLFYTAIREGLTSKGTLGLRPKRCEKVTSVQF